MHVVRGPIMSDIINFLNLRLLWNMILALITYNLDLSDTHQIFLIINLFKFLLARLIENAITTPLGTCPDPLTKEIEEEWHRYHQAGKASRNGTPRSYTDIVIQW